MVNGGGDVGIGVTPSRKLDVQIADGSSNGVGFLNAADQGLEVFTDTIAANADLSFNLKKATASMLFKVAGSTKLTISSGGTATFSNYIDTPEVRQGGEFMIGRSSNIIRMGSGDASDSLAFYAGGSQAMSISSGGAATFSGVINADAGIIIGGNTGLTSNNYGSGNNSSFLSSHASQPLGILIHYNNSAPNGTGNDFIECKDTSAQRFTVRSNGGVANYSGNNVNLSDESVKKNITDTPTSLNIIKNLEVKDFQYIDQTDDKIHTGVIAQQVLKTDPNLVDQSGELKMVYNTDLMFKMLKAIQEQQTIIDTLTARLDVLEKKA
jgi:hypothetical protein